MAGEVMHLARPIEICGKIVKNRVVVPAISDFGSEGWNGLVYERHLTRYGAFADGGAGLIIIEACSVVRFSENRATIVLDSDECLGGLRRLAEVSGRNGAVSLVQIMLTGLSVMPEKSIAEIGREKFLRYKRAFVMAAERCRKAGFAGIELHAAHGMYLNEVVETSARNDEYGGSFENRMRLIVELVGEIKEACGADFIVAVRFGSRNYDELLLEAQSLENAGADLLDVSSGCGRYCGVPKDFPYDGKIYAASLVKRCVHIPVICVGNIMKGEQAEDVLSRGYADLVAVGRGHLSDPAWADKVMSGEEPEPCRRCKMCMWYIDGQKCPAVKIRGKR